MRNNHLTFAYQENYDVNSGTSAMRAPGGWASSFDLSWAGSPGSKKGTALMPVIKKVYGTVNTNVVDHSINVSSGTIVPNWYAGGFALTHMDPKTYINYFDGGTLAPTPASFPLAYSSIVSTISGECPHGGGSTQVYFDFDQQNKTSETIIDKPDLEWPCGLLTIQPFIWYAYGGAYSSDTAFMYTQGVGYVDVTWKEVSSVYYNQARTAFNEEWLLTVSKNITGLGPNVQADGSVTSVSQYGVSFPNLAAEIPPQGWGGRQ